MSLWKLAKSIAKDNSEDINDVYERLLKNRKKLRRLEGRICVKNNEEERESNNS